jgi:NADH dehydrogenase [ubiquinone] 1 alpha subcomplex assembly factor 7
MSIPQSSSPSSFEQALHAYLQTQGCITVEDYMRLCLNGLPNQNNTQTNEFAGYYHTRNPFGVAGDFITSPEIGPLFGECIGIWVMLAWEAMGSPPAFNLIELGPGRGTLMLDVLRTLKTVPACLNAAQVHLVETSLALQARQQKTISPYTVTHHLSLETIPSAPCLILANEFFDALPIQQYAYQKNDAQSEGWYPRCVQTNGTSLSFCVGKENLTPPTLCAQHPTASEGSCYEYGAESIKILNLLAHRLKAQGGAALIIDYGYTVPSFGDTLQALKAHQFVDALHFCGEADLTSHVDFSLFLRAVQEKSLHADITTQADFLENFGIRLRAARLMQEATTEQKRNIIAAVDRLCERSQTGMGTLFKVLMLTF